jgi:hypothetical protein
MIFSPDVETKTRLIGGTRTAEGIPYQIPRPFLPEHFESLREPLGVDPAGVANSLNQTLAENITNNKGTQIKAIREFNEALLEAQEDGKRLEEEPKDYPSQADIDDYLKKYDFSGAGREAGDSTALTLKERELWKLAKRTIREALRENGMKVMPKDTPVEDENTQISWDYFVEYAGEIVNKEGIWGDPEVLEDGEPVYFQKCEEIHRLAEEAEKAASASAIKSSRLFKKAA